MRGTVKMFRPSGWGFIAVPGLADVFVSTSRNNGLLLEPGDRVEFELKNALKPYAVKVRLIAKADPLEGFTVREGSDGSLRAESPSSLVIYGRDIQELITRAGFSTLRGAMPFTKPADWNWRPYEA
jgi:cold shock CspA family protein